MRLWGEGRCGWGARTGKQKRKKETARQAEKRRNKMIIRYRGGKEGRQAAREAGRETEGLRKGEKMLKLKGMWS